MLFLIIMSSSIFFHNVSHHLLQIAKNVNLAPGSTCNTKLIINATSQFFSCRHNCSGILFFFKFFYDNEETQRSFEPLSPPSILYNDPIYLYCLVSFTKFPSLTGCSVWTITCLKFSYTTKYRNVDTVNWSSLYILYVDCKLIFNLFI